MTRFDGAFWKVSIMSFNVLLVSIFLGLIWLCSIAVPRCEDDNYFGHLGTCLSSKHYVTQENRRPLFWVDRAPIFRTNLSCFLGSIIIHFRVDYALVMLNIHHAFDLRCEFGLNKHLIGTLSDVLEHGSFRHSAFWDQVQTVMYFFLSSLYEYWCLVSCYVFFL